MSINKIVLPKKQKIDNVFKSKPVYSEEYKNLVNEADAKIMEARYQETKILHDAKNFFSTSYRPESDLTYKLYIEDLVGNLFYSLKKRDIDANQVSYKLISEYEYIIACELEKINIKCFFDVSRDKTNNFFYYNNDIYADIKDDRGFSIAVGLVNDLPIDYFINHYQGYLSLDLLKVIIADNTIDQVIAAYNEEIGVKQKVLSTKGHF